MARDGFQGVGINAVAREAGVDKVLIYRYFGGLPELLDAYGRSADFWWTVDELVGDDLPPPTEDSLAGWLALVMERHVAALERRPATRAILAWEMTERNPLTEALAEVREERSLELMRRVAAKMDGRAETLATVDVPAISGVLAAACNYLVVRRQQIDAWNGIDVHTDAGWNRLIGAVSTLAHAALRTGAPPPPAVAAAGREDTP